MLTAIIGNLQDKIHTDNFKMSYLSYKKVSVNFEVVNTLKSNVMKIVETIANYRWHYTQISLTLRGCE